MHRKAAKLLRFVLLWLALTFLISAVYASRTTTELDVYLRGAERIVFGVSPYDIEPGLPPYTYPPAMAIPVMPLLLLSPEAQPYAWCAMHAAMLLLTIWLLDGVVVSVIPESRMIRIVTWTLALLIAGRHLLSPLANNSHDLLVLAAIALGVSLAGKRREVGAGVAWGLAAALKATPLLFLPVLLVQLRWRAALAMVVGLGVASMALDLAPTGKDQSLLRTWISMTADAARPGKSGGSDVWAPWNPLNQNLSGTIYRLTSPPAAEDREEFPGWPLLPLSASVRDGLTLAAQGAVGLGVLCAVRLGRRRRPTDAELPLRRLAEAGIVVVGMLMLSPMSSKAHFCVLLLPALAATTDVMARRRDAVNGGMLALSGVIGGLTSKGLLGRGTGSHVLAAGSVLWSALLLGLATVRTLAYRKWDADVPDPPATAVAKTSARRVAGNEVA